MKQDVREYTQMEADLLGGKYDASGGVYNIAGLKDPQVDAAIKSAAEEDGMTKRRQKIMAAEVEILRTDAVLPLVHEKVVQGISTDVEGVLLDPRERSLIDVDTHLK
ncbi:hypothetical protein WB401_44735 [Streptomyces brasiliscabiei]|uniref:ABC transporter substrate-binding protein n=1 Tax=Streptomyces brasiliscabiei TaxID=2736302 RepID=A0ABU8G3V8_9ACTN